jgi:hypothetical protein
LRHHTLQRQRPCRGRHVRRLVAVLHDQRHHPPSQTSCRAVASSPRGVERARTLAAASPVVKAPRCLALALPGSHLRRVVRPSARGRARVRGGLLVRRHSGAGGGDVSDSAAPSGISCSAWTSVPGLLPSGRGPCRLRARRPGPCSSSWSGADGVEWRHWRF